MSQGSQRVLAAIGLVATLLVVAPAPAQASGLLGGQRVAAGLVARAWVWLASHGVVQAPTAPSRKPAVIWEKEGSAIDPNGQPVLTSNPSYFRETAAVSGDQN